MKKITKLFVMVLTVAVLVMCLCLPAMAAGKEAYTYKVTISAGGLDGASLNAGAVTARNGSIGSAAVVGDKIVLTGVSYGTELSLAGAISADGTRYQVRGYVPSGRDYGAAVGIQAVTGDTDLVAAYSVPGEQVAYQVQYLDEEGNALAEAQTFYGTIGDKPVATYVYVEGYLPQALNLTKTLSANEAENIFVFVYTPVETEVVNVVETETTETAVAPAEEPAEEDLTALDEDAVPLAENGPADLIDLDEDEVPLANGKIKTPDSFAGFIGMDNENGRMGAIIGASIAGFAVLAGVAAVLLLKRKKEQQQ